MKIRYPEASITILMMSITIKILKRSLKSGDHIQRKAYIPYSEVSVTESLINNPHDIWSLKPEKSTCVLLFPYFKEALDPRPVSIERGQMLKSDELK